MLSTTAIGGGIGITVILIALILLWDKELTPRVRVIFTLGIGLFLALDLG